MVTLAWLMTVHFVADFLLQDDWMALQKSKDVLALSAHVAVYTFTFAVALQVLPPTPSLAKFLIVTAVAHWLTDFVTSRVTSRLWFIEVDPPYLDKAWSNRNLRARLTGTRHWFFVAVGGDQLIHCWTLCVTWLWVAGGIK